MDTTAPTRLARIASGGRRGLRATVAAVAGLAMVATTLPSSAWADEASPTPAPTVSPADTPSPETPTPPTPGSTTPDPTTDPTTPPPDSEEAVPSPSLSSVPESPTPSVAVPRAEAAPGSGTITLRVRSSGSPQAGRYFEDLGQYVFDGAVAPVRAGQRVEIYWYNASSRSWRRSAVGTTNAAGRYRITQPVGGAGILRFRTTLGGVPSRTVVTSNEARATVNDSKVVLRKPVSSVDSLQSPVLTGYVSPARAGVRVHIEVTIAGRWRTVAMATSAANGGFRVPFAHGRGNLTRYAVRTSYQAINRNRWEVSGSYAITRAKVISAAVRATTAADVAKTYRNGCPVGPSKLRTVTMNFYGFDGKMHRGVMIVRKNLADDTIRGFTKALKAGFPIAKMNNPNVYGGNDPKQMAANNTSGFNCRKVVGNPYRMSPHSYGIAIDVNTVQNPYRDKNGKWWPKKGKKYIDRTPRKKGMLTKKSALTKQLKRDHYFWGGLWSPGRDYQHFEKR